jgi:hypothetical protein
MNCNMQQTTIYAFALGARLHIVAIAGKLRTVSFATKPCVMNVQRSKFANLVLEVSVRVVVKSMTWRVATKAPAQGTAFLIAATQQKHLHRVRLSLSLRQLPPQLLWRSS